MYSWLIDILFLVIAIVTIRVYTKCGFVKSVFMHGRALVAGILTFTFGPTVSAFIRDKFIYNGVYNWVCAKVNSLIASATGEVDVDGLVESLPFLVRQFVDPATLKEQYGHSLENLEHSAQAFSETVATPVAGILSNLLSYIAVFFVATLVLIVLGFLLDLLTQLPIIHGINCFLGCVLGFFAAFVWLSLLTYVISLAVSLFSSVTALQTVMDGSLLFRYFHEVQLFKLF